MRTILTEVFVRNSQRNKDIDRELELESESYSKRARWGRLRGDGEGWGY